ncbi:MAG: dihydropteroate synthase [bacterium]|nr:dihydropteroate synthase [bacterium]
MNIQILDIDNISDVWEEMRKIRVDKDGISIMASKSLSLLIKLHEINIKAVLILKQEMLSLGGEVALPKEVFNLSQKYFTVLLFGNLKIYQKLVSKLKEQYFDLPKISQLIEEAIDNYQKEEFILNWKNYRLSLSKKTHIMGVLNITPDSFSDGDKFLDPEIAYEHALKMIEDGVDIIDIGGRSTRPGSKEISVQEELNRVIPLIEKLSSKISIPISIDTYRAEVAQKALAAGASIVNDISGLYFDSKMAKVVSENQVPIIIMHIKGTPENMQKDPKYHNLILEITDYLRKSINKAKEFNIPENKIIIDPGIGFGKTTSHNLEIIKKLKEFKILGKPILIGTSRKSFIGNILDLPPEERVEGSAASVAISIYNGAHIVRVHDIKEIKKTVRMVDAIKSGLKFEFCNSSANHRGHRK